jgi:hypothetical protein
LIRQGIDNSSAFALIGTDWLGIPDSEGRKIDFPEDWVRCEIAAALDRTMPVFPALVQKRGGG